MNVPHKPSLRSYAAALFAATALWGCDKPLVAEGNAASVGGIDFAVGEYEVRYLEVHDGSNTYEYGKPVLVVPVTMTNKGKDDFNYAPTNATQQMSEAQTPLLYSDPGPDADLPPESKALIAGVYLEKGAVDGSVTGSTTLKPGDSITDKFLFEVPAEAGGVILSMPPSMHRKKLPVLFRIAYTPKEAAGPPVYEVGGAAAFEGVEFSVTSANVEYVKTRDSAQGKGYSSEPLLKISYKITNNSDGDVTYNAAHRDVGGRGAMLHGQAGSYKRVKFAATTTVEGQKDGSTVVAAGSSLEDFVLFDRPDKSVDQVTLEYPASLFGRAGLARFKIGYEFKDPPLPKELSKKEETPAESDGG